VLRAGQTARWRAAGRIRDNQSVMPDPSRRNFLITALGTAITALSPAQAAARRALISAEITGQLHSGEKTTQVVSSVEFENVLEASGIRFALRNSVSPQRFSIETMLGGVAAIDYNNDGLLDLFFTNGAAIPSLEKTDPSYFNRLFRNNGDGTFTDVTEKAGLQGAGYSMGVAAGDYDNDGFVDLYVTGVNRNQLFHNNGDGTFTDVTDKAGVGGMVPKLGKAWAVAAGWFDYNNDGHLDLFVVNYLDYDIKTARQCPAEGIPAYCSPNEFQGTPNILYRNNGDGTFTDVSAQSRIAEYIGKGMGLAFADYDDDGFTDIFISNDTFQNYLLHNNGDGTFTDAAMLAGVQFNESGKYMAGMGADFRDIDNDGKPDIFQTSMFGDSFQLYQNTGSGEFQDVSAASGLTRMSSRLTGWGTGIFDFDNDGNKDIFTANAEILDNSMAITHRSFPLPNSLFRNRGNLQLEDLSANAGPGFSRPAAHRGAAFGDFNNDGKIDIAVSVINGPPQILINRSRTQNHWIILNLVGTKSNRDAIGTKVRITTAHGSQYNHVTTAVGYNSSSDKRVHFGVGDATVIDKIELAWPSGIRQVLTHVKADQVLTITESAK
jgi:enediyne biosynthesis protein E4